MKRLVVALSVFFPGHGFVDAPSGFFGHGKTDCRMILAYWGDEVNPIGGYRDGRGWISDSECLRCIDRGTRIDIVKLGVGKVGAFVVERLLPPSDEPHDAGTVYAKGKSRARAIGSSFSEPIIGVLDPRGRPPKTEIIPSEDRTYRKVVEDFLKGEGIKKVDLAEMFISQIVRVDLEGDGVDEVFISVQSSEDYLTDFWEEEGSRLYSYLFMRKAVNGKERIFVLYGEQYPRGGDAGITLVFKVAGFWDLDRDGVLEVITNEAYYEGFGLGIYSFDGGSFIYRVGWGEGV